MQEHTCSDLVAVGILMNSNVLWSNFKFLELIAADQLGNGRAVPPHPPRTLLKCVSVLASGLKPNGNPARLNKV